MNEQSSAQARIALAKEYFRKVDNGDPTLLDIVTDDVETYFPKFGVGQGKAALMELAQGLMGSLKTIRHDPERMTFHVAGDHLIVEGFESGVMADGTPWPVPGLSEGRFANVFAFDGQRIKRVYIYVDPDFRSAHAEGFLWGRKIRMTTP